MSILHVEFQEGWTGEPVALVVNGEVRFHGSPRTRTQIGFAESVTVEADEAAVLELEGPEGTRTELPVHEPGEAWLGLSREDDGSIRVIEQSTPFGYV
ncbi:hypothetical protein [Mycetocola sp. 2940]|uniref:hypothetical protein n=1 Tax=Mycetocola sp. 2940 TaxID=3156452 RepID=UPI003390AFEA